MARYLVGAYPAYPYGQPVGSRPQVLLRHSTVGPFQVSQLSGKEFQSPSLPGLVEFLQRLSLLAYFDSVKRWCEDQGACDLSELVENADDLATALMLPPTKREELKNGARIAQEINQKLAKPKKLNKALSTPVTQTETHRAQETAQQTAQTVRLGMAVLHAALEPIREGLDRTETDYWDEREAAAHAVALADPVLSLNLEGAKRGKNPHEYDCSPRNYYVQDKWLKQRNPTEAEVQVKDRVLKAAREEIMAEWGPDDQAFSASKASKHAAFDQMREQFLDQYAGNLHAELGKGYKLTPAEVAPSVKDLRHVFEPVSLSL